MKNLKKIIRTDAAFEILDNSNCAGSDWGSGGCAILAQAINKIKGYPIYVIYNINFKGAEHFGVKTHSGTFLDHDGEHLNEKAWISFFKKNELPRKGDLTVIPFIQGVGMEGVKFDNKASDELAELMKKQNVIRECVISILKEEFYNIKRKMIVLVGPPSVGKSTWIKSNFPNSYIINRDDVVESVASSYGFTYDDLFATPPIDAEIGDVDEKYGNVLLAPEWMTWTKKVFDKVEEVNMKVKEIMDSKISNANHSSQDIVIDMTNMNVNSRRNAMKAIEGNEEEYHKVAVDFKFKGAEEIIKKIAEKRAEASKRMGKSKTIPPASFERMFNSYEKPTKSEGFDEIISVDNIENLKNTLK